MCGRGERPTGETDFDEFTATVQHRLELPGTGDAVRAIRATLMTLGSRIPEEAAEGLATALSTKSRWHVTGAVREHGERGRRELAETVRGGRRR